MEYIVSTRFLKNKPIGEFGLLAKSLGFSGIELPLFPGFPCEPESASKDLAPMVRRLEEEYEINVPLVTHGYGGLSAEVEALYAACAEAGVRFIQPEPFALPGTDWWDCFEDAILETGRLTGLSEAYGVKTLIPISYGKSLITTCLSAWMLASYSEPPFVGISYDPGFLAIDGEDREVGLGILSDYLGIVVARNCVRPADKPEAVREAEDNAAEGGSEAEAFSQVTLEAGVVSWEAVIQSLRSVGYDGIICFSADYSDGSTRTKGLSCDLEYISTVCRKLSGPSPAQEKL